MFLVLIRKPGDRQVTHGSGINALSLRAKMFNNMYTIQHIPAQGTLSVFFCLRIITESQETLEATMLQQDIKTLPEFTYSDPRMYELLEIVHQISDLQSLGALADWDQNTAMPGGAAEVRGYQQATLQGVLHERWTSPRLGNLLQELHEDVQQASFTDADRGLVREAHRIYTRAAKLPRTLVEEIARVQASSFEAWRNAREQSDFALFSPLLTRTIALQREVADRLGFVETRYDALLNEYEPGMTASKLDELFAPVRETSINLLRRIEASGNTVDDSCLEGEFSAERQIALCEHLLRGMGYDFSRGQLAQSPHPFTTSFGSPFDVRVTVRTHERYIQSSLMAAIHEGGHAIYEQGSAPTLVRTPIAGGASMGLHESQSRLWENAIGRSEPYWHGQYSAVREAFPQDYAHVDVATFARALNKVQPSLIRVEADEVTYNLHIMVRFELEKALINGDVAIETLPSLWNQKYREYLGVEPDNDAEGVLQDVHWSSGFGYFPSYTLGNLYSAQIFHKLHTVFPDFDARLARGDTAFVLEWLREQMYVFGVVYRPEEVIQRVTGDMPNPEHFTRYLTAKFEKVYDLPLIEQK
ncbi:MAG: carboxypeptidase M32 [Ktedonobacteraceae bacterium]